METKKIIYWVVGIIVVILIIGFFLGWFGKKVDVNTPSKRYQLGGIVGGIGGGRPGTIGGGANVTTPGVIGTRPNPVYYNPVNPSNYVVTPCDKTRPNGKICACGDGQIGCVDPS